MGIRLLLNRVAIRPDEGEEISKGGIHLTKATTQLKGTVVTAGPGAYLDTGDFVETVVKPGDRVAYSKQHANNSDKIEVDGEELLIMPEDVIIAVIED